MTVAVYVSSEADAASLISWGVRFAHADHTDLSIITPKRSKGKVACEEFFPSECSENSLHAAIHRALESQNDEVLVLKQDVSAGVEDSDLTKVIVETKELIAPSPDTDIIEVLNREQVSLLLLPAREHTSSDSPQNSAMEELFSKSPCDTCMIKGAPPVEHPLEILIATHGGANIEVELNRSRQLVQTYEGNIEVLFVGPNDDVVADQVAAKKLGRMVREVSGPHDLFDKQVVLRDSLVDGIQVRKLQNIDMLLIGTQRPKTIRQVFRALNQGEDKPHAVAVMRQGIPITSRLWTRFERVCRSKVPQLNREQRVELVDRLQSNSRFDFDFIALISLSTLIAGLGLIRNSAAVVIGAMLVAPLMTPLVGIGFALLQGNDKLVRNAMRSVLLGFAVAFGIGAILGLLIPNETIISDGQLNQELISRCTPNLLDLIIALVSGIAGAYATGRPNLIGALPGVAIAAALVPPIATSGICLAVGELRLSWGASLLFFTNIVAIVLGTTVAFWGIGINSIKREGQAPDKWPRYWFFAFVVLSLVLAILNETLTPVK